MQIFKQAYNKQLQSNNICSWFDLLNGEDKFTYNKRCIFELLNL
ncbi:unnamed protein product [Paramecium octaurelia]|uniref:Uncharacterized protein n=1 Tax=Paramecium octaurelia TaxID=43137 RepID=A0A8S1XPG6_PAROT|nr:unnamed protein product [Paramecium octaurelia]